ncbi:MAG TPA: DNA translocase FtsK [Planctomycetota bacterium]|nr:DNA translocase FtsK [Planctomycetota bacterium]
MKKKKKDVREGVAKESGAKRTTATMLWGAAAMALGFFAFASVVGYHPDDPNLFMSNRVAGHGTQNPCGWLGANVAYHLVSLYGLTGWILPLLPVAWGVHVLARRRFAQQWRVLSGAALFILGLCSLFGVMSYGGGWLHDAVAGLAVPAGSGRAGGLLGALSAEYMVAFAGALGSYFLIGGILFLSLVLISERLVDWMLSAIGRWALALMRRALGSRAAGGLSGDGGSEDMAPAIAGAGASGSSGSARFVPEPEAAVAPARRDREKVPSVRATFGQPEAELRKGRAAAPADAPASAPAPLIKIARVTEPAAAPSPAAEAEREKREIAALLARANTPAEGTVRPDKIERKKPEPAAAAAAAIAASKVEAAPPKPDKEERKSAAAAAAVAASGPARESARPAAARGAEAASGAEAEGAKAAAEAPEPIVRQMADAVNTPARVMKDPPAPKPSARPQPPAAAKVSQRAPAKPALAEIDYKLPEVDLLDRVESQAQVTNEVLARRGQVVTDTLKEFKIQTRLVSIDRGPAVTIYELELAPGIRVQRVMELADNLAMAMKAPNVRIIAPIPGKDSIGIEVPNTEREVVRLRPLLESKEFRARAKDMAVPVVMGRDAAGAILMEDLARMPHLLVAGATGSGKSVCLNSFISTILMTKSPADVRMLMVDPKMVEMACYRGIPHLVAPVVTDMKRAVGVFEWALRKMDERYAMLSEVGVRDIARFNRMPVDERAAKAEAAGDEEPERFREQMPYLVLIIDELADLMMLAGKEIEMAITRLAQKSRGVGIHIILATQRPSVDVVTGLIKANMPARVAFQVSSKVDSRTIIDQNGAEKLMGMGDMLYLPPTSAALVRAKGTYVSDDEVNRIVEWSKRQAEPEFAPDLESTLSGEGGGSGEGNTADFRDDLYDEAVRVVLETQRGSVSLLQRRLGTGYTRAAKLIDMMAERGILGPYRGSKPRDILVTLEQWEAGLGNAPGAAPARGGMAGQRADERGPRGAASDDAGEEPPEPEAADVDAGAEEEEGAELATSESQRLA